MHLEPAVHDHDAEHAHQEVPSDSTAEIRYLVLPQRPPASDGLDEAALAARVTRDHLVGVAR